MDRDALRLAARLCQGPSSPGFSRRDFFCTAAGAAVAFAAPSSVRAQTATLLASVPQTRRLDFLVLRNGSEFGNHSVVFADSGDELRVAIKIDLRYTLGPLTLFRYSHQNNEIWRGGKLASLDTVTDDDGTPYRVSYRGSGDKATVTAGTAPVEVPGNTIPTSYWNVATVNEKALLSTQTGELLKVDIKETDREKIALRGQQADARRFAMTGDLALNLWYAEGVWVKIQFEARGSQMEYVLR